MENNTQQNNTQRHVAQKLFTELFRPQTLEQAILVPRVRQELEKGLQDNILLYGKPGCGKCLGYNEEITIYVDEKTQKNIKNFLKNRA